MADVEVSPRARRKQEMSARLLDAARSTLEGGERYVDLSVERLTALAGISRSNFYVYFEDKSELLRLWLRELFVAVDRAAESWWKLGPGCTEDDLREVLASVILAYRPNATILAGILDLASLDSPFAGEVRDVMRANTTALSRHIATGQMVGFVDPVLHPTETAVWLESMAERVLNVVLPRADDARVEQMIQTYTDIVWRTLYKGHADSELLR